MSGQRNSSSSSSKGGSKSGQNGSGKSEVTMGVLEMETESFLTTTGASKRQSRTDQEYGDDDDSDTSDASDAPSSITGSMSNNQKKATVLMLTLALLVGLFVLRIDQTVEAETLGVDGGPSLIDHVVLKPQTFHTNGGSFGGINNLAHPGGAKAAFKGEGIAFAEIIIPKSNVGHATMSINRPNIVNLWGHYVHDEHRSPYASHLYNATNEELEERQQKYLQKMEKVREEWGAWDFRDPLDDNQSGDTANAGSDGIGRMAADFSETPYKDLPVEDFPPDSWQADEEYVARFLEEGKKLVHRVKEGIYAEYGFASKGKDEKFLEERDKFWKINVWDPAECETEGDAVCGKKAKEGIASLQKNAFDALVQKLLHAMMTNDQFYAVLGGHSAAAGHGDNFQQNRIITFHHLMEPVFDKLGMMLISRNMAMGGVGTLQFTLAGGDLYGETDILEWDSGMTEKGAAVDLFNKQAILSGERVPIIMTEYFFNIMTETNGTAWMGAYVAGNEKNIFPDTTYENAPSQPYAARWYNQKEEKFNAICWEPRSDFTPLKAQSLQVMGQASWHPGNRQHQWSGRKLALTLLEALGTAFERWEEGVAKEGCPLAASNWHVGDSYKIVRENLRTHISKPPADPVEGEVAKARSACEILYPSMPRICRMQMHGFGMWNPRAHVDFDFLNLVHPAPNGYKPEIWAQPAYDGFNLMPLNQAVPDGEVDVHAIAIATTSLPPKLDHSWIEEAEVEVESDGSGDLIGADGVVNATDIPPPTRRWLREASELGFRRGAEVFPPSTVVKNRIVLPKKAKKTEDIRSSHSSDNSMLRRQLEEDAANANTTDATDATNTTDAIVPGRGWIVYGPPLVKGFCDGSAQSECDRNEENKCLLYAHNDHHISVTGSTLSGWLVFTVPKVREGIILVRMEWWCNGGGVPLTKDWTEVNDGKTHDTTPFNTTMHRAMMGTSMDVNDEQQRRNLKPTKDQLVPADLEMDWAINGVIKTMKREEWLTYTREAVKNVAVWPLFDDVSMAERDWEGEPVEVAIRFRSEINPQVAYCVSHVYYA